MYQPEGRIDIEETLAKYTSKTWKDFKQSNLYRNIIDTDSDAIVGRYLKKEYSNALLNWAEPDYAFAIELGKDWESLRDKQAEKNKEGYIYMVMIDNYLFKYGRTQNVRKRMNQYPRGSKLLKCEYVRDMFEAEKILLNCANESNGKLFHGNEYYYHKDTSEPDKIWEKALKRINL